MRSLTACLAAAASLLVLASPAAAIPGLFPGQLLDNSTGCADSNFLGAPDDTYTGIGGQVVTFDFGDYRITNGSGPDFNVYEVDYGSQEFGAIDVLVSMDGTAFISVTESKASVVRVDGDDSHGDDRFARSYDLGSLEWARYIRIDGKGSSKAGDTTGFDLDAVGAIHFSQVSTPSPVPEPSTLLLLGSGLAGLVASRRRR